MILLKNLAFAVIVKLVNVEECEFRDVNAAFAAREGEGDGSLEFWKISTKNTLSFNLRTGIEIGQKI